MNHTTTISKCIPNSTNLLKPKRVTGWSQMLCQNCKVLGTRKSGLCLVRKIQPLQTVILTRTYTCCPHLFSYCCVFLRSAHTDIVGNEGLYDHGEELNQDNEIYTNRVKTVCKK